MAGELREGRPTIPGYLQWLTRHGFTQEQFDTSGFIVDVTDSGLDNGTRQPGHFGLFRGGDRAGSSRVRYNRLLGSPNLGSTLNGCDGHGTLNAHIIGGYSSGEGFPFTDASGFHYGLGIAPFVQLGSSVIFDPDTYTFPNFTELISRAYQDGARISANSWGAAVAGAYNIDAQIYDSLVRDAQPDQATLGAAGNQEMVIVFAAGNSGPSSGSIGAPGTAKNVITVGAGENVHPFPSLEGGNSLNGSDGCGSDDASADNANDMAVFSSRGPCADGRSKPDIIAPGTHVTGGVAQNGGTNLYGRALDCFAASGVCALAGGGVPGRAANFFPDGQQFYSTSSGTSHSTPAVAGGAALLRQYLINQGLTPPSPALTKAWLINASRYMTGSGAGDTLPSPAQGFGEMDLGTGFNGAPRIVRDQMAEDLFTTSGTSRRFTARVADSNAPVRITLAWTDAPGATFGNAYNNDLDLVVTVGGKVFRGNVFSGRYSTSGGRADSRNNVESVFLPPGITGDFTVTIVAANINSDGVPNNATQMDQDFALVVANARMVDAPVITSLGWELINEGCQPSNGAIDPYERVTVAFTLQNIGSRSASNVVISLVETPVFRRTSPAQSLGPMPAGAGQAVAQLTFTAHGSCLQEVIARLLVKDGDVDIGEVTVPITLGSANRFTNTFSNPLTIAIPAEGNANPYPSTINVNGLIGQVEKISVTLSNLSHTYPDDLDILLAAPNGRAMVLMSDAGGSISLSNITLSFEDTGMVLPDNSAISAQTYQPGNFGDADTFPTPAPAPPYLTRLNAFQPSAANGPWHLFVVDDAPGDAGRYSRWMVTDLRHLGGQLLCGASGRPRGFRRVDQHQRFAGRREFHL